MVPETVASGSPQSTHIRAEGSANVTVVRVEFGKELLALLVGMTLVIGACGTVMGLNISEQHDLVRHFDQLDRQSRMTELKLDDWSVVAHRAGLILPSDYTRGPEGNPDEMSFHIKQLKR